MFVELDSLVIMRHRDKHVDSLAIGEENYKFNWYKQKCNPSLGTFDFVGYLKNNIIKYNIKYTYQTKYETYKLLREKLN